MKNKSAQTEEKQIKNKSMLHCQSCSKEFFKQFDLIQHERTHTGEKPFACDVCNKKFNQKSNMKKHLNSSHRVWPEALRTLRPLTTLQDIEEIIKMYSCQFCALQVKTYSEFKKHLVKSHLSEKVYKCLNENCLENFKEVNELIDHVKNHKSKNSDNDNSDLNRIKNRSFKCKTCNLVFKRLEALQWHLSVESHNHVCPKCNATYLTERYLRRHLVSHTKPIICSICSKVLKYGQTLKNHMFLHERKNGFKCEICDKVFVNFFRLKRHNAIHSDKPLVCTFRRKYGCDKRFSRKDKLLNHIRTHTNLGWKENGVPDKSKICDKSESINITYDVIPDSNS